MADVWDLVYESGDGSTRNGTQPLLPLAWQTATVTSRDRAPDTFEVVVPRESEFAHALWHFKPGREFRIKRNGAWWFAGFLDAPGLQLDGDGRPTAIVLRGWGTAYALLLNSNSISAIANGYLGYRTDLLIGTILDDVEHGTAGDWFPAAGRSLATGTYTLDRVTYSGKSALAVIGELCDLEGWRWRAGINAAGTFTFAAGPSVAQDLTGRIGLTGADSRFTGYEADGSRLASLVRAAQRTPSVRTQLNGAHAAGATTFTVDSTAHLQPGDQVRIGQGTANAEGGLTISSVPSGTVFTISFPTSFAHADNETVEIGYETTWRWEQATITTAVEDDHHPRVLYVFDDSLQAVVQRQRMAAAVSLAYDHELQTVGVLVTDPARRRECLNLGLRAGDLIALSSSDRLLSPYYTATPVRVREATWSLVDGRLEALALTLGDPRLDDLAVLEAKTRAGQAAATSVLAT